MSKESTTAHTRSFREEARLAKMRMKNGFWKDCQQELKEQLDQARELGVNESKAGRFFAEKISRQIAGKKEDEFYLRVKEMLLAEGEVSDAIGRLTDKPYYETLSYEEKQRYTLSLSEKYLRALERFRKECQFDSLHKNG